MINYDLQCQGESSIYETEASQGKEGLRERQGPGWRKPALRHVLELSQTEASQGKEGLRERQGPGWRKPALRHVLS